MIISQIALPIQIITFEDIKTCCKGIGIKKVKIWKNEKENILKINIQCKANKIQRLAIEYLINNYSLIGIMEFNFIYID
jgi:hypothetical protein